MSTEKPQQPAQPKLPPITLCGGLEVFEGTVPQPGGGLRSMVMLKHYMACRGATEAEIIKNPFAVQFLDAAQARKLAEDLLSAANNAERLTQRN